MNICISGATGFIGSRLTQYLTQIGHTVTPIYKDIFNSSSKVPLQKLIEQSDIVVNLAGENIDQKWTPTSKMRIIESRTRTTRAIVTAINQTSHPKLLISASAVGIYPLTGCHTDYSRHRGGTFLSCVCRAWEGEAAKLDPKHSLAITRFGVVLTPREGVFERLTSTLHLGFLPRIGDLNNHLSWVDREDLVRAIALIMVRDDLRGAINICAPEITLQRDFINAANPIFTIPISPRIIRAIKGEAADLILKGCCTIPKKLIDAGFIFNTPTIKDLFDKAKK